MPSVLDDSEGHASTSALLLLVTALWGLNMVALKTLSGYFEPVVMAVERCALAALFLLVLLGLSRRSRSPKRLSRRQWGRVFACAVTMIYLNQLLLSGGLMRTTATNASVAIALSPLVSSLMAALLLRERIGLRRMTGVVLGFVGVLLTVLQTGGAVGGANIGDALVIASVVVFAIGGVLLQGLVRETDALYASAMIFCGGTSMLALHALSMGATLSPAAWAPGAWPLVLVLFSSLIAMGFGNLAWNHAIRKIGVSRVSVWFYWVPIFGVGFSALLLGETLSVWHGLGLAAVICGTLLATDRA